MTIKLLFAAIFMTGAVAGPWGDRTGPETVSSHLAAEPQVPTGKFTTATEVRPILTATKSSWVAVREYGGEDLLYVTQIWAWRCGLVEMKVGVNGALPQVWPLPPCHIETGAPNAITEADGLPYARFPLGSIETVEVQLTFDDLGTDTGLFARSTVLMP